MSYADDTWAFLDIVRDGEYHKIKEEWIYRDSHSCRRVFFVLSCIIFCIINVVLSISWYLDKGWGVFLLPVFGLFTMIIAISISYNYGIYSGQREEQRAQYRRENKGEDQPCSP